MAYLDAREFYGLGSTLPISTKKTAEARAASRGGRGGIVLSQAQSGSRSDFAARDALLASMGRVPSQYVPPGATATPTGYVIPSVIAAPMTAVSPLIAAIPGGGSTEEFDYGAPTGAPAEEFNYGGPTGAPTEEYGDAAEPTSAGAVPAQASALPAAAVAALAGAAIGLGPVGIALAAGAGFLFGNKA